MLTAKESETMCLDMNLEEMGPVYSVGIALWQTEPTELFKAFLPKSLKIIPIAPVQRKH